MRNAFRLRPKSSSRNARTTCARLAGFSSTATASSRSMQTASASEAAAFSKMFGRGAGIFEVDADRIRVGGGSLFEHVRSRRRHVEHRSLEAITRGFSHIRLHHEGHEGSE